VKKENIHLQRFLIHNCLGKRKHRKCTGTKLTWKAEKTHP